MLVESLIKATVELQGFRVLRVTGDVAGVAAELVPDGRYAPRCGRCDQRGAYREHAVAAALSSCAAVGHSCDPGLHAAAGPVSPV